MRKIVQLAFICLLFLTSCTSENEIKIGFISALTGEAAVYGQEELNALMLAVNEINNNGGINGKKIKIIPEDDQCSGNGATLAAQKLINIDNVKIILGTACSGAFLGMAPITEEAEVLVFASYATAPDVASAGKFIFRNSPSDAHSAISTASLAYENGIRKMAVISENTEYAMAFRNIFLDSFEKLGGTIVADEIYAPDARDFKSMITKIKAANPGGVVVNPQGMSGGLVVRQLAEQNYNGPLFGNVVFSISDMTEQYGEYVERLYFSNIEGLDLTDERPVEFLKKYRKKHGKNPSFSFYAGGRYDSMYLLKEAIEKVGEDPKAIKHYLENLDEYAGVIGTYSFDENGDIAGASFVDYQIVDGQAIVIS